MGHTNYRGNKRHREDSLPCAEAGPLFVAGATFVGCRAGPFSTKPVCNAAGAVFKGGNGGSAGITITLPDSLGATTTLLTGRLTLACGPAGCTRGGGVCSSGSSVSRGTDRAGNISTPGRP